MAAPASRYKMSQERLDALKAELFELETVKTQEVAELIKEARSFGDLSENSEYDEAKEQQGKLYSHIAELKDLIENAQITDEEVQADLPKNSVTLGSVIEVLDVEENEKTKLEMVGSQEADPRQGRISDDSPLGQALHGHKKGETVTVEAPNGAKLQFKILKVTNK